MVAHFLVLPNRTEIIKKEDLVKTLRKKTVENLETNKIIKEDVSEVDTNTQGVDFRKNMKLCLLVDDSDLSYIRAIEIKDILEQMVMQEADRAREITNFEEEVTTKFFFLKDFWIELKRGNPEIFELLDESIVTYDQGFVSYIKYLVEIGVLEMNPTASESMIKDSRENMLESVNKILGIIDSEVCGSIFTSVAALIVRCGFFPPKIQNMLEMVEEILKKEYGIVSEEFIDQLKYFIEIRTKGPSGHLQIENIPEILSKAFNFIGEIEEVYHILEQRKGVEEVERLYSQMFDTLKKLVHIGSEESFSEDNIVKIFKEKYIKTGKIKEYYLRELNDIRKFKQELSDSVSSVYEIESYRRKVYEILDYLKGFLQREAFEKKKEATINVLVGQAEYKIVSLNEFLVLITQDKRNLLLNKEFKIVRELEPEEANEIIFHSQKQSFEITVETLKKLQELFEDSNIKILL